MRGQGIQSVNFGLAKLGQQLSKTLVSEKWGVVKKIEMKSFDELLLRKKKYCSGQFICRLLQKGLLKIKTQQESWNAGEVTRANLSTSSSISDEIAGAGGLL